MSTEELLNKVVSSPDKEAGTAVNVNNGKVASTGSSKKLDKKQVQPKKTPNNAKAASNENPEIAASVSGEGKPAAKGRKRESKASDKAEKKTKKATAKKTEKPVEATPVAAAVSSAANNSSEVKPVSTEPPQLAVLPAESENTNKVSTLPSLSSANKSGGENGQAAAALKASPLCQKKL